MKRIVEWFINTSIKLLIIYIGGHFALSILAAGFIYYPEIMMGTDRVLSQPTSGLLFDEIVRHIVGIVPLSYLLVSLVLTVLVSYKTMRLALKVDIVRIMAASKAWLNSK